MNCIWRRGRSWWPRSRPRLSISFRAAQVDGVPHKLPTATRGLGLDYRTAGCHKRVVSAVGGSMTLSARNHLKGKIEEIQKGDVLVHVTVRVGDHQIESVITRRSAD